MGGEAPRIYDRPVPGYPADKWRSTYGAHTRRNPPSREPGVDYYCPLGTVLVSLGDGYVSEIGGGTGPATGRYVRVNMDNGQGFRLLHLGPRHSLVPLRGRVKQGQPLAISGASGYGSEYFGASNVNDPTMIRNTGGPHTHLSLFPRWNAGYSETIDPEPWMKEGDFLMALTDQQQAQMFDAVANIYSAMFVGGPSMEDAGRPVQRSLDLIHRGVREVVARLDPIYRDDANGVTQAISVRQELADAKTGILALLGRPADSVTVDVDESAIVAGVLAGLDTERILAAIQELPAETIAALKAAL